ncbi:hypothetical protein SRHO_G00295570 [Serrasalmus rhombeus]
MSVLNAVSPDLLAFVSPDLSVSVFPVTVPWVTPVPAPHRAPFQFSRLLQSWFLFRLPGAHSIIGSTTRCIVYSTPCSSTIHPAFPVSCLASPPTFPVSCSASDRPVAGPASHPSSSLPNLTSLILCIYPGLSSLQSLVLFSIPVTVYVLVPVIISVPRAKRLDRRVPRPLAVAIDWKAEAARSP